MEEELEKLAEESFFLNHHQSIKVVLPNRAPPSVLSNQTSGLHPSYGDFERRMKLLLGEVENGE